MFKHLVIALSFCLCINAQTKIDIPYSPSLSPDGSQVIFSWNDDIWISSSEGGLAKRMTQSKGLDYRPMFSHDGKKIAFESNRLGPTYLFVMPTVGGPAKQVSFNSEGYRLLQWFRDNQSLAYNSNRKLFVPRQGSLPYKLDTVSQEAEELIFNSRMREFNLSPDEKKILFTREGSQNYRKAYRGSQASQIWLYDSETQQYTKIIHEEWNNRTPLWSADGKGFFYLSDESACNDLMFYDFKKKKSQLRYSGEGEHILNISLSSDGSTLSWRRLFDLYTWKHQSQKEAKKLEIYTQEDLNRNKTENRQVKGINTFDVSMDGLEMTFAEDGLIYVSDSKFCEPIRISDKDSFCIEPIFSNDFERIFYLKDNGQDMTIMQVERADKEKYWWQNHAFETSEVFSYKGSIKDLNIAPDDSRLSFVSGDGSLWTYEIEKGIRKKITNTWMEPDYSWSPDSQWFIYSCPNENYNSEIFVIPSDASQEAINISRNPASDRSPTWSKDGSMIAYVSDRSRNDSDIILVYLKGEDYEISPRQIKYKDALKHMKDERPLTKDEEGKEDTEGKENEAKKKDDESKDDDENEEPSDESEKEENEDLAEASEQEAVEEEKTESKEDDKEKIVYDWNDIHLRTHHIRRAGSNESRPLFSQDSDSLICISDKKESKGTYTFDAIYKIDLEEKSYSFLTFNTTKNFPIKPLKKNGYFSSIAYEKAAVMSRKKTSKFEYSFYHTVNLETENNLIFSHSWRLLKEKFYDPNMNNLNWEKVYEKYAPAAREASNIWRLSTIINMMVGELNASHLGFSPNASYPPVPKRLITAHTGLRFERKDGKLFIGELIPKSPAANIQYGLQTGDHILELNYTEVNDKSNLDKLLTGLDHQSIHIKIKTSTGDVKDHLIESINPDKTRALLDQEMVDRLTEKTESLSDGNITYLHIDKMNFDSFYQFHDELYSKAYGKDGIVIDVRDNAGGSTADHLMTILTQPDHAFCQARDHQVGYPDNRSIYTPWKKPIVVLCNQNSFSNAEIFTHAVKTTNRGQVVGVPSAGGVISTWGTKILNKHRFRLPMRGWYLADTGLDMELNGAKPDYLIWPEAGDLSANRDPQLIKAIEVLKKDIVEWKKKREKIRPIRAHQKK